MMTYIALLRGINMGGHNKIAMAELRDFVSALGFADVRTVLQSGNIVFRGRPRAPSSFEKLFETETAKRFGIDTRVMVRSAAEWEKIVAGNPFRDETKNDPAHLAVVFLKDKPVRKNLDSLKACITGREYFHALGRELYVVYPDGFATSKFTLSVIDRKLETRGTARNWNTVLKLAGLTEV
ncbi:MAG: DUF1697 domain-containing protein [Alphaproteobacteria bacterium]|nr:DUF1697 domain-containing protein [Alphaproteobacteria bacterium]MDE2162026.1 DUF1697 domain-containing protein [Alphaproteobacteria bacterium]MDE2265400.1 DUF1697 domain-containing protein [Alphaproteobacteria bacterium]